MTKKMDQKGFSLVEGLLVIIAVALVAFVGYYVYHAQSQTNKTYSVASKVAQSTPKKSASSKSSTTVVPASDANLQVYLIKTCSSNEGAAVNAMFANKSQQTVETDNYKLEGNYAISNVNCTLTNGTQLSTEFLKYSGGNWALVVNVPTSVNCQFLTNAGFPDALKAPYCSNGVGGEGNF
ncbi:MAG: hypothetical protein JWL89_557 [Candidatus Saccharibacteria bacterium]|jgi:type II secretory pathway pseudopilin PulG|nr:hypothetical protein [Candidatus Saccharibacteria bacterium]